jgi:hypothetical protein
MNICHGHCATWIERLGVEMLRREAADVIAVRTDAEARTGLMFKGTTLR